MMRRLSEASRVVLNRSSSIVDAASVGVGMGGDMTVDIMLGDKSGAAPGTWYVCLLNEIPKNRRRRMCCVLIYTLPYPRVFV